MQRKTSRVLCTKEVRKLKFPSPKNELIFQIIEWCSSPPPPLLEDVHGQWWIVADRRRTHGRNGRRKWYWNHPFWSFRSRRFTSFSFFYFGDDSVACPGEQLSAEAVHSAAISAESWRAWNGSRCDAAMCVAPPKTKAPPSPTVPAQEGWEWRRRILDGNG